MFLKRRPVDYSGFSLRRLNEPRFAHAKLLAGWLAYFALYFLTENLIPAERCHVIHCALDDLIPFNEYFVIFYVGWYFLVAGTLAYYFLYDIPRFRQVQIYIMITQAVAMACYILYPSMQDLRPVSFARSNLFTWVVRFIYSFDTPTGVFPSLHVAYSMGILSVGLKNENFSALHKTLLALFVLMVCLAVCFVKQHSALDVLAALPVCLVAELAVFGLPGRNEKNAVSEVESR